MVREAISFLPSLPLHCVSSTQLLHVTRLTWLPTSSLVGRTLQLKTVTISPLYRWQETAAQSSCFRTAPCDHHYYILAISPIYSVSTTSLFLQQLHLEDLIIPSVKSLLMKLMVLVLVQDLVVLLTLLFHLKVVTDLLLLLS